MLTVQYDDGRMMSKTDPFSKKAVMEAISSEPAERLPLPAAYTDPAFNKCLFEAASTPEFIENFDRLTGSQVGRIGAGSVIEQMIDQATGFRDEQIRKFVEFVHDSVYLRLPHEAIHAIRLSSLAEEATA